jgi:carbon monoxide dehydrogenase subunit G
LFNNPNQTRSPSEDAAVIEIDEEIVVPAPPDQVWKVVSDPSEVVSCISGAELGESHEDGTFDGALVVKFSAIRVRFGARITLDLDEPERQGRLSARGRDGQGATRYTAHADFRVVEDEAVGSTRVRVQGEVTLAGRLASVIEAGAGAVVSRMSKSFADELALRCTGEATGGGTTDTAPPTRATTTPPRPSLWARARAWWRRTFPKRQNEQSGVASGTSE